MTDTQAIRERAERLRDSRNPTPSIITVREVCSDLLAALDREKVLEAELNEAVNWNDIVDRHGCDQFDDIAEKWLALEPIKRVHNAVASVFSKWANDELMTRFKQHMANSLQMAFVEGCLCGVRTSESQLATLRQQNNAYKTALVTISKARRMVQGGIMHLTPPDQLCYAASTADVAECVLNKCAAFPAFAPKGEK